MSQRRVGSLVRVGSMVVVGSLAAAALSAGCTARGERPDAGGGGYPDGGGPDAWMRMDFGVRDPFNPDASCGAAAIPTQRIPGSLLLVFDRSSSMDEDVNGHRSGDTGFMAPTKWDASTMAIDAALSATGDDLSVGLLLFPTNMGNVCDVALGPGVPQVQVAPLLTNRSVISSALSGGPNGSNTPLYAAMWAGYNYLDTLTTPGQRGLVVVTDGAENCDSTAAGRQAILDEVQRRHDTDGYITFAVGLTTTDSFLSSVALNGGTARDSTCVAECVAPPTACGTGTPCATGTGPCLLGFCINSGGSTGECCNYSIGTSSFRTDFQTALDEIARHFLESCVFELPRGADPTRFDPSRVNVGVTFTGESRNVLGRSSDSTVDSWDYTSPAMDSIVIQGPVCDRLLTGDAQVEIVLGCPTIVI